MDFYVYVLMDSSKPGIFKYGEYLFYYEPFYVGRGRSNRINETLYDKSQFKKNKIKKLKLKQIQIISKKIKELLTIESANELEKKLISIIGRRDMKRGPLVNATSGGDGRFQSIQSAETKEKISKSKKGKIGFKHSKNTIIKMSERQKGEGNNFYGKNHSEETKSKQSERVGGLLHPMYEKSHNKETIEFLKTHRKINISNEKIKQSCQKFNKPVLMYDINLNFIKEFKSVKDASLETKINESLISKCCRGEIKSPTRYYFKYKNTSDNYKNNSFLIPIGGSFIFNKKEYTLIKRNKKTCICRQDDQLLTMHEKTLNILFEKQTNNIDIIELYLFLKNINKSFKLKDNVIFDKQIKIRYLKLINNSEFFGINNYNDDSDVLIFADEWLNKKDIVKSILSNLLNKNERIWARKCIVKEITDNKLIKDFLNKNHIQGFVGSKIKLGLFYDDELVSLMTFGNLRKSMGHVSKEDSYELLRFCSKLNLSVVGGASKLFKFFIKNYKVDSVISYADRRFGKGDLYEKLGFTFKSITIPNYYYIINNKREYRFKWRKDILVNKGYDENKTEVQIMNSMGYFRIFDKGSRKYEFKNINA